MPRRSPINITNNHERWLVSYSDFITLLFAFFVVMYSISQVNESKYRVLSETLTEVFSVSEPLTVDPFQVGEPQLRAEPSVIQGGGEKEVRDATLGDGAFDKTADLPQLSDMFVADFADLISKDYVEVHSNELWLEVELKAGILFESGGAKPNQQARDIFAEMAAMLKDFDNPIQVEGFTDDIPIETLRFPSNWELSTARAAAVVKLLAEGGVTPDRLAAVGYGEHQPIASNATAQGREANRRVTLMISRQRAERPKVADPEVIAAAVEPVEVEVSAPFAQPNLVADDVSTVENEPSATEVAEVDTTEPEIPLTSEERLAPIDTIQPVETEGGGLLFSADPDT